MWRITLNFKVGEGYSLQSLRKKGFLITHTQDEIDKTFLAPKNLFKDNYIIESEDEKYMINEFKKFNTYDSAGVLWCKLNNIKVIIATGENTLTLNSPPLPPTAASQSSRQHIRNKMTSHLMRQHEKGMILAFIN